MKTKNKKNKKIINTVVLATIAVLVTIAVNVVNTLASSATYITFKIGKDSYYDNHSWKEMDACPYIQTETSSTMIPVRVLSELLGVSEDDIQFDSVNKIVTIIYNGDTLKFYVGSNVYTKNGVSYTGNGIVEIKDGRTYVPLRSLADAFGLTVEWNAYQKEVIIEIPASNTSNSGTNTTTTTTTTTETTTETTTTTSTTTETTTTTLSIREMEEEIIKLINEAREENGLESLQLSKKLMATAQEKADDMSDRNYFSHTDPDGYNMANDLNVAEVITGTGTGTATTIYKIPSIVVSNFMNSSAHKEILLTEDLKYIGVGVAEVNTKYYWVIQLSSDDKWAN